MVELPDLSVRVQPGEPIPFSSCPTNNRSNFQQSGEGWNLGSELVTPAHQLRRPVAWMMPQKMNAAGCIRWLGSVVIGVLGMHRPPQQTISEGDEHYNQ